MGSGLLLKVTGWAPFATKWFLCYSTAMPNATQTLIDISIAIHPKMVIYPGDPGVAFDTAMDITQGAPAHVTRLSLGSQTGTHFDAPHHILGNGLTVSDLP